MKSMPGMRMFSVYCPRLVTTPRPCRRATSVPTILKGPTGGSSFCVDAARLAPGSLWPCAAITFVSISDCSATSCCQSGSWESAYQSASLRLAAYAASCATRTASRRAISSLPLLDRAAEAREQVTHLLLGELGRVPLDRDRPLAAADVEDAVALL